MRWLGGWYVGGSGVGLGGGDACAAQTPKFKIAQISRQSHGDRQRIFRQTETRARARFEFHLRAANFRCERARVRWLLGSRACM